MITIFSIDAYSITSTISEEPFGFHPALIRDRMIGYSEAENIGVTWTRPSIYAYQAIIQTDLSKDEYDFRLHDRLYGETPDNISILGNIAVAPSGNKNRQEDFSDFVKEGSYQPVDIPRYERFVKATVERYDGDGVDDMPGLTNPVKYWQVDNEPPREGKDDFAVLQEITYKAIKEACPDCQVMIGGATGFPDTFDRNFKVYTKILKDLNGEYIDIFDFHWYGNALGEYRELGDSLEIIKKTLDETGFGDIPIWITEMGSYSGSPNSMLRQELPIQTEQMQASDYFKRYIYPISQGVKKVFPAFGLIEGFKQDDGYFDHTGLIYDGKLSDDLGFGVKKLSYWTYKFMTDSLTGSDWSTLSEIYIVDSVYGYKIIKDNKPIWIVWWDWFEKSGSSEELDKDIRLQFEGFENIDSVKITEVVPDYERGIDIEGPYPDFFKQTSQTVDNGLLEFTIGINPVIIEVVEYSEVGETLIFKVGEKEYKQGDTLYQMDVAPIILEERTYLPARYVVEPLGGTVSWDEAERRVICMLNDTMVELWINKPTAIVDEVEIQIDPNNPEVVPTIVDGRTMVPMRFLAENIGCEVEWVAETKEIILKYSPE